MVADQKMFPSFRKILFISVFVSVVLSLKHRSYYFGPAIFETGDYAANALQITGAKHFHEIYGNYSRWGFNHPGPIFFYIYATSERLFYDAMGIFHSPHQAHAFAGMVTQSVFFAFAFSAITQIANSRLFTASLAVAAVLHFSSVNEAFTSIWPPNVLIFPFMAFLVSAALFGRGNLSYLPCLVICACFLAHGHVAQPLFLVPITGLSLVGYFRFRCREAANKWQFWFAAIGIVILFLLPLLMDATKGLHSNFAKILNHLTSHVGEKNTLEQSVGYLLTFLFYMARPEVVLAGKGFSLGVFVREHFITFSLWAIAIVPGTMALWFAKAQFPERPLLRSLSAFSFIAILLTIYWGRIQEGEMYAFNAFFNYALIFLLLIPSIYFLTEVMKPDTSKWPTALIWLTSGIIVVASPSLRIDAELQSAPQLPIQVGQALRDYPTRPILLRFAHEDWPKALGVALALQRSGEPFRIAAANWRFSFWQPSVDLATESEILSGNGDVWSLTPLEGQRAKNGKPFFGSWGLWRPFYTPLSPTAGKIDFSTQGNSQNYSIIGISEPSSSDFVWTTSSKVGLYFSPLTASADVGVRIEVVPFLGNGKLTGQTVTVTFNGARILSTEVKTETAIAFIIPSEIWNAKNESIIALNLPEAISPAALGLSADPRLLALGIKSISFSESPHHE